MMTRQTIGTFFAIFFIFSKVHADFEPVNWRIHRRPRQDIHRRTDWPICVVGAGFSGIGVALQLEKLGHNVEIFEKESKMGGKVKTFRIGDQVQVDMCPLLISPVSTRLINFITEFNFEKQNFDEKDRWGYSIENMEPKKILNPTKDQIMQIGSSVQKYVKIIEDRSLTDLSYGYLKTSPNLFVPMKKWLDNNNLQSLRPIITMLITTQGYGDLEDIPALYVMQLLDKYKMTTLVNPDVPSFFYVKEGLDKLIEKIASKLSKPVNLKHEVKYIQRREKGQTIQFRGGRSKQCSKVVLAFPPLLPNIQKIMQLDKDEGHILEQVKIHKYTTAALSIPRWNHSMYVEALPPNYPQNPVLSGPKGTGEVTAALKQSISGKRQHIYSSYSWIRGDFHSVSTPAEMALIRKKLEESLFKIDKNGNGKSQILDTKNPEYFPHVNTTSLQKGFYKKFDAIQGRNGVYYATTLLTFEIMEKALEMAENLSKKISKDLRN